jgi:hypothetical protein
MAEFFAQCLKQVRKRLGFTDSQLEEQLLYYLSDSTKQCILNDSFGNDGVSFVCNVLPVTFSEWWELIDRYYEITTFHNVELFKTMHSKMSDQDFDLLTKLAPKLKSLTISCSKENTDLAVEYLTLRCKNIQLLLFWGDCSSLTNYSLKLLSQLENLNRLALYGASNISDEGTRELSKFSKMSAISIFGNNKITDISVLPDCHYLEINSNAITSESAIKYFSRATSLLTAALQLANLNDEVLIALLKNNPRISTVDFKSSTLTEKSLNSVPLPCSFQTLWVTSKIQPPKGSDLVVHNVCS